MVLAQKQKHTSMEQDRKLRNKPKHLWLTNLLQRRQEHTKEAGMYNGAITGTRKTGQLQVQERN